MRKRKALLSGVPSFEAEGVLAAINAGVGGMVRICRQLSHIAAPRYLALPACDKEALRSDHSLKFGWLETWSTPRSRVARAMRPDSPSRNSFLAKVRPGRDFRSLFVVRLCGPAAMPPATLWAVRRLSMSFSALVCVGSTWVSNRMRQDVGSWQVVSFALPAQLLVSGDVLIQVALTLLAECRAQAVSMLAGNRSFISTWMPSGNWPSNWRSTQTSSQKAVAQYSDVSSDMSCARLVWLQRCCSFERTCQWAL